MSDAVRRQKVYGKVDLKRPLRETRAGAPAAALRAAAARQMADGGHGWQSAQFAWPTGGAAAVVADDGAAARLPVVCQIAGCGTPLDAKDGRSNGYNLRTRLWCVARTTRSLPWTRGSFVGRTCGQQAPAALPMTTATRRRSPSTAADALFACLFDSTLHMRAPEVFVIPPGAAAGTAARTMRFCQK